MWIRRRRRDAACRHRAHHRGHRGVRRTAKQIVGALPQFARRSTRAVELFAGLPDADGVADLSVELLFKAVGAPKRRRT